MEQDIALQPADAASQTPQTDTQVADAPVASEQTQVAESDEQRNERVLAEAREKAEKRASGVQKRIDELTADKYAERRRAEELARQNEQLLQQLQGAKPQAAQPAAEDAAPKREQFQDDWSYINAHTAYVAQQKAMEAVRQASETAQQQWQRQQMAQREAQINAEFAAKQKEFIKTAPDYLEVIQGSDFPVPTNVLQLIKALPDGPAVTYHMAKNPDIAKQFFSTPPELHGFILGQISATLKAAPRVSNAPAPGKPVGAKGGTSTDPPDDPEQYYAWAQKNLR